MVDIDLTSNYFDSCFGNTLYETIQVFFLKLSDAMCIHVLQILYISMSPPLSIFEHRVTLILALHYAYSSCLELDLIKYIKRYQPVMKSQYTKEIQDYYEHLSVPDNSGRMKAVFFSLFVDRFSI